MARHLVIKDGQIVNIIDGAPGFVMEGALIRPDTNGTGDIGLAWDEVADAPIVPPPPPGVPGPSLEERDTATVSEMFENGSPNRALAEGREPRRATGKARPQPVASATV